MGHRIYQADEGMDIGLGIFAFNHSATDTIGI